MFATTRSSLRWVRLSLVLVLSLIGLAIAHGASADDRVYRYRRADGRDVFTNAGNVAVGGQELSALALPPVTKEDLVGATPLQLHQLDRGVQHAHDALQAGERCKAIRASSRVRTSTLLFRGYLRELCVAGALLGIALTVFATWHGKLRQLMPLSPLIGSLYLGYATYARVELRVSVLREGLRACSSELPPTDGVSPSTVAARLDSARSLQSTIDRAYRERERAMLER